jgi:hypothetical protein
MCWGHAPFAVVKTVFYLLKCSSTCLVFEPWRFENLISYLRLQSEEQSNIGGGGSSSEWMSSESIAMTCALKLCWCCQHH